MSSDSSPGRLRIVQRSDGSWSWSYREAGSDLVLWGSRPERGFHAALDAARTAFPESDGVVLETKRMAGGGAQRGHPWVRKFLASIAWSAVAAAVTVADLSRWIRRRRSTG